MLNSGFIDLILSTTIELVDFARLREYIWLLEFIAFIIANNCSSEKSFIYG